MRDGDDADGNDPAHVELDEHEVAVKCSQRKIFVLNFRAILEREVGSGHLEGAERSRGGSGDSSRAPEQWRFLVDTYRSQSVTDRIAVRLRPLWKLILQAVRR